MQVTSPASSSHHEEIDWGGTTHHGNTWLFRVWHTIWLQQIELLGVFKEVLLKSSSSLTLARTTIQKAFKLMYPPVI